MHCLISYLFVIPLNQCLYLKHYMINLTGHIVNACEHPATAHPVLMKFWSNKCFLFHNCLCLPISLNTDSTSQIIVVANYTLVNPCSWQPVALESLHLLFEQSIRHKEHACFKLLRLTRESKHMKFFAIFCNVFLSSTILLNSHINWTFADLGLWLGVCLSKILYLGHCV